MFESTFVFIPDPEEVDENDPETIEKMKKEFLTILERHGAREWKSNLKVIMGELSQRAANTAQIPLHTRRAS